LQQAISAAQGDHDAEISQAREALNSLQAEKEHLHSTMPALAQRLEATVAELESARSQLELGAAQTAELARARDAERAKRKQAKEMLRTKLSTSALTYERQLDEVCFRLVCVAMISVWLTVAIGYHSYEAKSVSFVVKTQSTPSPAG
jgi:hypothetical protein